MKQTSSYAVLSKARALYGQRLKRQDWQAMLDCVSVTDIAAYLKAHTAYRDALAAVDELHVHRGELEAALKQRVFEESERLARYDLSLGEHISVYLIERMEIQIILRAITRLNSGKEEEPAALMAEFQKHTRLDQRKLQRLSTFDQLLEALHGTAYEKLLLPFAPQTPASRLDYTRIENAFYGDLYRRFYQILNQETKGETREGLLRIFDDHLDLANYARTVRLKTSYGADPEQIRSYLLPFGSLRPATLRQMSEAEDKKGVDALVAATRVGKRNLALPHQNPSDLVLVSEYHTCRKNIRMSKSPSVVMFSYIFLLEEELRDLTMLIEGVRYGLDKAEIRNFLNPDRFSERSA